MLTQLCFGGHCLDVAIVMYIHVAVTISPLSAGNVADSTEVFPTFACLYFHLLSRTSCLINFVICGVEPVFRLSLLIAPLLLSVQACRRRSCFSRYIWLTVVGFRGLDTTSSQA